MTTIQNFAAFNKRTYAEESQNNKLWWMILKHIKEETFEPASNQLICKDFLNDVVLTYNTGVTCSIYGFTAKEEMFNRDWLGLPILLTKIEDNLYNNLTCFLNDYLNEQGFPLLFPEKVVVGGVPGLFINLPVEYLKNTHHMSTITLLIRNCNVPKDIHNWQELYANTPSKDQAWLKEVEKKPLGSFPKKFDDYLWYWNNNQLATAEAVQAKTVPMLQSSTHNCGVVNWDKGAVWTKETV